MLKKLSSNDKITSDNKIKDIKALVRRSLGLDTSYVSNDSSNFNGISSQIPTDSNSISVSEQSIVNSFDMPVSCNEIAIEELLLPSLKECFEIGDQRNTNQENMMKTSTLFEDSTSCEGTADIQQHLERETTFERQLNRNSRDDLLRNNNCLPEENECNKFLSFSRENGTGAQFDVLPNKSDINKEPAEMTSISSTNENILNAIFSIDKPQIFYQSPLRCDKLHAKQNISENGVMHNTPILQDVNCASSVTTGHSVISPELKNIKNMDTKMDFNSPTSVIKENVLYTLNCLLEETTWNSKKFTNCQKSTQDDGNKQYFCLQCLKSFRFPSKLKKHIRSHKKNYENVKIEYSESVLNIKTNVEFNSKMSDHSKNEQHKEKRMLQCPDCSRTFRVPSKLKRHVKTHTGLKPYACHLCPKTFLERHNLKAHINIHSKEQPYVCGTCNKAFSIKSNLNRHIQSHEKEKQFNCSECGIACKSDKKLKIHVLTHQDKPHKCVECEKGFDKKSNLKRHVRIHNNERIYPCNECDYTANQSFHLKRHTQIKHTNLKHFSN